MKIKKYVIYLVVLSFFVNFVGCAGMSGQSLDTAHKRANFMMRNFDAFFDTYNAQANWSNLTAYEIKMLNTKRTIGIDGKITADVYCGYVATGEYITPELTQKVFNYLDRLLRDKLVRYDTHRVTTLSPDYVEAKGLQQASKAEIEQALKDAGIIPEGISVQMSPALVATIIEIVRQSIQAAIILIQMKAQSNEQAEAAFAFQWPLFKAYDMNVKLPVVH